MSAKKHLLFILFVFFGLGSISSFSQNCNSELSVYRDRVKRSVTVDDSTNYRLELTNNSGTSENYLLNFNSKEVNCESNVNGASTTSQDLGFNIQFLQNNNGVNGITVPAYGTVTVYATVSASAVFRVNTWTCIELTAKAERCNSGPVVTVIEVFASNSIEN